MIKNSVKSILIDRLTQIMPKNEAISELDFLLKEEFNIDKKTLILEPDKILTKKAELEKIINKRIQERKPLQYIINKATFYNQIYYVDENVLIPRPETELLVSEVLKNSNSKSKILDIGTGSGCIAISLAILLNNNSITSCDISKKALNVAEKNRNLLCKNIKINFVVSDIYTEINEKFDIIVSNPPYIDYKFKKGMQKEVIDYEPHLALFADEDGLYFYKKIINDAPKYLNNGGLIALEIGIDQSLSIKKLLIENHFSNIRIITDFSNIDRIITAKYN